MDGRQSGNEQAAPTHLSFRLTDRHITFDLILPIATGIVITLFVALDGDFYCGGLALLGFGLYAAVRAWPLRGRIRRDFRKLVEVTPEAITIGDATVPHSQVTGIRYRAVGTVDQVTDASSNVAGIGGLALFLGGLALTSGTGPTVTDSSFALLVRDASKQEHLVPLTPMRPKNRYALIRAIVLPFEQRMGPRAVDHFNKTGEFRLGTITLTREGIDHYGTYAKWEHIRVVQFAGTRMVVRGEERLPYTSVPLAQIPSFPLAIAVLQHLDVNLELNSELVGHKKPK